jgi:hypothetical protein
VTNVVGFTGTQRGLTLEQLAGLNTVLRALIGAGAERLDHGDCVGADHQAHLLAITLKLPVGLHPPIKKRKRAFCRGAVVTFPEKPYLDRNRDIVEGAFVLVATPRLPERDPASRQSGTWYTVRQARKRGLPIVIVWPSGIVNREGPTVEPRRRLPLEETAS